MRLAFVVLLLFVVLYSQSLADSVAARKTNKNKKDEEGLPEGLPGPKPKKHEMYFNPADDDDGIETYAEMMQRLKQIMAGVMKKVGYNLFSLNKTMKATVASFKGLKACYSKYRGKEFNACAQAEIDKTRAEFDAIIAEAEKKKH